MLPVSPLCLRGIRAASRPNQYGLTKMITTVRDFLVAELGGSTFMWDVFLGVLLAFGVVFLVQLLFWIVSRPFR